MQYNFLSKVQAFKNYLWIQLTYGNFSDCSLYIRALSIGQQKVEREKPYSDSK